MPAVPLVLCLETSTKVCSAAVGKSGQLLALKESADENFSHSEKLTLFIEECCREAKISLKEVDAIAVSKGPGSFTGLRIGVSTAKGLCYALNKPLIAIHSLEAMAAGAIAAAKPSFKRLTPFPSPEERGRHSSPVYYTANAKKWHGLKEYGREMRKTPTKAEEILWEKLRNKKTGHKIRRQHAIGSFICDFVCLEKQLAIELDGSIHKFQREEDRRREEIIGDKRFSILRFTNEEVFSKIEFVISTIKKILNETLPPPTRGGDWGGAYFCPMLDAKRMEVYTAVYDEELREIKKTSAEIIDENSFSELLNEHRMIFFGDGAQKCKPKINHPNAVFLDNILPSAHFMLLIAEKYLNENPAYPGEDLAYFEPFYLKDFVGVKAK